MKKTPNTTDQWVYTEPDSVHEVFLGSGRALVGEAAIPFTEGWLRMEVVHRPQTDLGWGIMSGWDELAHSYAIFFFVDPLPQDLPEQFLLWLDIDGSAARNAVKEGSGLELWAEKIPEPPTVEITSLHSGEVIDEWPTVLKMVNVDSRLVTMYSPQS